MSNEQDKKQKNSNVPNLRFGTGGQSIPLKGLVECRRKSTVLPKKFYVSTENLKPGFQGLTQFNSEELTKGVLFKTNDVLLANIRPYLKKAWLANRDGCCSPDVICFFPKAVLPSYLFYAIANDSFISYVMETCKGSKMPRGDKAMILKRNVFVPGIEEQKKAANFLSLIDKRINVQIKIIEELSRLKSETLRRLFSSRGKMKHGRESKLSEFLSPGSKTPVNPSEHKRVTIHLNHGGLSFVETDRVLKDTRPFYLRSKGELIIGKQNYFHGSVCLVEDQFDQTVCSNAIMSFKIKGIDPLFLLYAVSNDSFIRARERFANGTGQKELSENDFLNFSIVVPSEDEQKTIASALQTIQQKTEREQKLLCLYNQTKQALLATMFI